MLEESNHANAVKGEHQPDAIYMRLTTQTFISRAMNIHTHDNEPKYFYHKSKYNSWDSFIIIICPLHGDFSQTAGSHLNGRGCPEYGADSKRKNHTCTTEKFIQKAQKIHFDNNQLKPKYTYEKTVYTSVRTNVVINCPLHGEFIQTPDNHLHHKTGCPFCSKKFSNDKKSLSTVDFIKKATNVHGLKYLYHAVNYERHNRPVSIICSTHGEFKQLPCNHLAGRGCPKCHCSSGEKYIEKILRENKINFKNQYTHPDCRNQYLLRFDFGILDQNNNLLGLIEFNGIQHYKSFRRSKIETESTIVKRFCDTQNNDNIKVVFCQEHKIPLLIIKYNDIDHCDKEVLPFINNCQLIVETY